MSFELARRVADAVLYEGYVLYPYRASSAKNRVRWQFGVVAPRDCGDASGGDAVFQQTEVLVAAAAPHPAGSGGPEIDLRVRFLQVQVRTIQVLATDTGEFQPVERLEVNGQTLITWEEAFEQEVDWPGLRLDDLLAEPRQLAFQIAGGVEIEPVATEDQAAPVRVVRQRWPLAGVVRAAAFRADDGGAGDGTGAPGLVRLQVRVENHTPWDLPAGAGRDQTTRRSLIGAHTLLAVRGGEFASATDPPAAAAALSCANLHTWPVLIGEGRRDLMLSSPIILSDYPEVAPESPGDLYDSTEIDEILTLRVMTLTDAEKQEARATDARSRAVIERSDAIPSEIFERLHGAIRYLGGNPQAAPPVAPATGGAPATAPAAAPAAVAPAPQGQGAAPSPAIADALATWLAEEGGGEDAAVATVEVGGVQIGKGASVVLRPRRRADAMDMFMEGRSARVEGVFRDVDGATYVAVTLEDDPAGELHSWYGRYFYFYPEEIEPVPSSAGSRLER
jgi:hypothetical protein